MSETPNIRIVGRGGGTIPEEMQKKARFYDLLLSIMQFHPNEEIGMSLKDIVNLDQTNAYLENILNDLRNPSGPVPE